MHSTPNIAGSVSNARSFEKGGGVGSINRGYFYFIVAPSGLSRIEHGIARTGIGFPRGRTRLLGLLSRVKRSSGPVVTFCGLGSWDCLQRGALVEVLGMLFVF